MQRGNRFPLRIHRAGTCVMQRGNRREPVPAVNSQRGNVHPVWALYFYKAKVTGHPTLARGVSHACASARSLALYSRLSPTRGATLNAQTRRARKLFGASPSSTAKIGVHRLGDILKQCVPQLSTPIVKCFTHIHIFVSARSSLVLPGKRICCSHIRH